MDLNSNGIVKRDEIMSPNCLLNTFANNNEDLLKGTCKDDNNRKEINPGVEDQNNYSVCKVQENEMINLEDSSTSKDLSDIYNLTS